MVKAKIYETSSPMKTRQKLDELYTFNKNKGGQYKYAYAKMNKKQEYVIYIDSKKDKDAIYTRDFSKEYNI